jgi:hypothetical protein
MVRSVVGVALVILMGLSGTAQEAVPIKIAHPRVGERAKVTIDEKMTTKSVFTVQGMPQGKDEVGTKSLIYVDEIIENPRNTKRADKLKRTYEKAVVGKDGNTKKLSVEGKTVLIERSGERYTFTIDGRPVGPDALKLLQDEFDKPEEKDLRETMFPAGPVKPGETWKINPDELLKALGEKGQSFDKGQLVATGKLVKTYQKDGKQFGVIEFNVSVPITSLGEKNPVKVTEGKMILKLLGDGCIDGSLASGKSTSKLTFAFSGSVMNIDLKVVVDSTENRTTEALPKR